MGRGATKARVVPTRGRILRLKAFLSRLTKQASHKPRLGSSKKSALSNARELDGERKRDGSRSALKCSAFRLFDTTAELLKLPVLLSARAVSETKARRGFFPWAGDLPKATFGCYSSAHR